MASNSLTTRALTYRDPTVTAAAEVQLRRNRQRSLDSVVNQAEETSDAATRVTQIDRNAADSFRAAQNAADQQNASNQTAEDSDQADQLSLSASGKARYQQSSAQDDQGQNDNTTDTEQHQQTATFTTQQIAQEHLGIGLHTPPLQPADEAYRRAGAEPPLVTEEAKPTLFAVAV
jgi:hypothetical protein